MDNNVFKCNVCGAWTSIEPMLIDDAWSLCAKCGDFENEKEKKLEPPDIYNGD